MPFSNTLKNTFSDGFENTLSSGDGGGSGASSALSAGKGAFLVTGSPAVLAYSYAFAADDGTFLITGKDATLTFSQSIAADDGTFLVTGKDATLSDSTGPSVYQGLRLYTAGRETGEFNQHSSSTTAFDISTFSLDAGAVFDCSGQATVPQGISIKPDGTLLWMVSSGVLYEYNFGTPFDLSTLSYSTNSYALTANSATKMGSSTGIFMNPAGTDMFIADSVKDAVHHITLDAWDIGSIDSDTNLAYTLDISSKETNIQEICLNSDGTKIFIIGSASDTVFQYSTGSAYVLSGSTFDTGDQMSTSSEDVTMTGMTMNLADTSIYTVGAPSAKVYQYDMTANDLSTGGYTSKFLDVSEDNNKQAVFMVVS